MPSLAAHFFRQTTVRNANRKTGMTIFRNKPDLSAKFSQVVEERASQRYLDNMRQVAARTDRVFAPLMLVQWLAAIIIATWITPRTWIGATDQLHIHVVGAVLVGGALALPVVMLVWYSPGASMNRFVICLAQVLTSVLLVHLCGGRIETHFHVFGSLAFLALYRTNSILILATVVVALDHMVRGLFWPESVFGVAMVSPWRWLEHAGWVLFEDSVLITACIQSQREMREGARQWANLSVTKDVVDAEVQTRTLELEQSEYRMRESSLRTRMIIDTAYDAFVVAHVNGTIEEWSDRASALFGWSGHEVIGKNINEFLGVPEMAILFSKRQPTTTEDESSRQRLETMAKHRDGQFIPVEASVSFVALGSPVCFGDEYNVNIFFHDISHRKEMQAQLLLAQKMQGVGQLAAGIAHEINTPTQYVGDNARFLQDSFRDIEGLLAQLDGIGAEAPLTGTHWQELASAKDLPYLRTEIPVAIEQALDGIQRISQITRAMKEFSHPGTHVKEATDPRRIIENSLTVCRNEWKYIANLKTEFDPELTSLFCLPGELSQVLVNLIVNAAQAIGDAPGRQADQLGTIVVQTRRIDGWAEISVTDNGPGIPPEILQRVFEPFFTTKEVGKGTGQGLAIAHAVIVEKHGGTISVTSEVGRGTTFVLRLPLEEQTSEGVQSREAHLVC